MEKYTLLENTLSEHPNLYAIPQRVRVEPLIGRGFRVAAQAVDFSASDFENFAEQYGVVPLVMSMELPINPARDEGFRDAVLWIARFQWLEPSFTGCQKHMRSSAYLLPPEKPSDNPYVRVVNAQLVTPYGGLPLDARVIEMKKRWPGQLSVRRVGAFSMRPDMLDESGKHPMLLRKGQAFVDYIIRPTDK